MKPRSSARKKKSARPAPVPVRPPPSRPAERAGLQTLLAALLLAAIATVAYSNTFHAEFQFDDTHAIQDNQAIRNLPGAFARVASSTRSLNELTFAINYAISGLNPWSYHVLSLLLHVLAAICMFGWLRNVTPPPQWPAALLAAALFAVHPLATQSVTYVVQRASTMAGLFFFASLWTWSLYRATGRVRWLVATVVATLAGMRSKEMAVVIPLALLAADFALHRPAAAGGGAGRWRSYLCLAALLAFVPIHQSLIARNSAIGAIQRLVNAPAGADITRKVYFLSEIRVIAEIYLRLMLIPIGLNVAHAYTIVRSAFDPRTLVDAAALTAMLAASAWAAFRSRSQAWRLAGFGGLLFFLGLSVASTVIPTTEFVEEQRAYVSLAGIVLIVALAWWQAPLPRRARIAGACAAVTLLTGLTFRRNRDWATDESLWSDAARKNPASDRAHTNLGRAYYLQSLQEMAKANAAALQEEDKANAQAVRDKAMASAAALQDKAMAEYRMSLSIKPDDALAQNNLGGALFQQRKYAEAAVHFAEAVRLMPRFAEAQNSLGSALYVQDKLDEAMIHYREAARLKPDYADPHSNIALILIHRGDPAGAEEAVREGREAVRLRPEFIEARFNLANALMLGGRIDAAIAEYREILRRNPNHADAKFRLEQALKSQPGKQA